MANTPNFALYKPARADNTVEVDTSLANNFTIIDTELKTNKDGLATHKTDVNAHASDKITHADGSVKTILDNHEERITDIELNGLDSIPSDLTGRLETVESDVEGILAPATFDAIQSQSYTFDEYRIGYVENKLDKLKESWVFASTFKTPTNTWKEAIESAITTANSTSKKVIYLPPSLQLTAPVVITKSNLKFVGFGTEITTVDTLTANIASAFTNGAVDIEDISFEGITFIGGQFEAPNVPMRYRDDGGATAKHSFSFDSAIRFNASLVPYQTNNVVKNVTIHKCVFKDTYGLPTYLAGLKGFAKVTDCDFDNCLDVGFIYNEQAIFVNNVVTRSHDNGVSLSRGNLSIVCNSNRIDGSAYAAIWAAGWEDPSNPTADNKGPQKFELVGNTLTNVGQAGIKLTDAPKWGTIVGNTIHTVTRGPIDEPQDNAGIGINIGGFPYISAPAAPTDYAKGLLIADNTIINPSRGGIKVISCYYAHISDNLIIDPGSQYYADGTTVIGSTNKDQNFGISLDNINGDTVNYAFVKNNTVIDTRVTPYSNYPLVCTGSHYSVFEGNKQVGFRNNLTSGLTQDTNRTNVFENRIQAYGTTTNNASIVADTEGYKRMGLMKRVGQNPSITFGNTLSSLDFHQADKENIDDSTATYTKKFAIQSDGSIYIPGGYLWIDATGKVRTKTTQKTSDTDGTVVGTQV